ncbi:MAG: M48 family metalloprotease [Candidatus Delongbacteria bacterium]|nr:M48 family metalloprotease [Candidatus Delongbacteria bacterium]
MIFVFWLSGMLIFLIKFGIDLYYANSIKKREYTEVNETFLYRFNSIAERMGVTRSVKFLESSLIRVPVVIGHLKPVILLPLGLVTKIPNDQIEAIISHELAHIMRNDFLHNLIQSVIEIIYFFNPAIYWISKQIRTERENCCDDLAMRYCSDSVNLAKGLYNLQEMQADVPKPMMAAVNNEDLLSRIKRIIGKEKDMKNSYTGFIASIIVIFLAVTIFTGCTLFAGSKDDIKTEEASIIVIKKSSDGENVKMNVLVTDGGDEDIEKQIFVTATNDGEIIKKVIKTEKNGDEKEMKVEVIVTNDGEKHIIKDHGKKIIFISDDDEDFEITIDPEDLEDLEKLEELEDIDFNFDFDFDDDFESTKIVITKDGVKKEIWIDTENMKEFTDQLKELKELNEDIIVDIQVLDDDNDIIIISDSDDHSKKIQKIIIKSNSDEELGKIKVIEEIDIGKIQDELVKDGIIKEKSEELIIFIDDDVIKINDKEIPAEHKEKYKKLLGGF